MIPIEKLKSIKTVVTHKNCADGRASALILKDALPDAEVVFVNHGEREYVEFEPRPNTIFCDIVPFIVGKITESGRRRAFEWFEQKVVVLDHHVGSRDVVKYFGGFGVFADEKLRPGVSGAVLAYEEVWLPLWEDLLGRRLRLQDFAPVRDFAALAGIYDTWQTKDLRWKQARAQAEALLFWPWEKLVEGSLEHAFELMGIGEVLVHKHDVLVAEAARKSYRFTVRVREAYQSSIKNVRVVMFQDQGSMLVNDVAEIVDEDVDLVVGFDVQCRHGDNEPYVKYSLRSHGTGNARFDCCAFAKKHGGGGHTAAAAFWVACGMTPVQPIADFERYLGSYYWERII